MAEFTGQYREDKMQYQLTEEQKVFRRQVRRLAEEKIAPRAVERDEKGEFPWDVIEEFRRNGIFSVFFPAAYGGLESGLLTCCLVVEEVGRASGTCGVILCGHNVGSLPIIRAGNEEQKNKYLPKLARGEYLVNVGITESGAGSDVASMTTRAVCKGDEYVINGTKRFISMANLVDILIVFAKTDPDEGMRGISAFIVEKGAKGFSVEKVEEKMGMHAVPTCEVIFDDCRISAGNLIGKEGQGFITAMLSFNHTRVLIAALGVGLAQGALDYAVDYAQQRVQFGRPIAAFQGIQFMLADMATEVEAARQLTYSAAAEGETGEKDAARFASMAKYFSTDTAMRVTTDSVQILGGYGYMKDYPLELKMREAKALQILEGTNQIQRVIVAKSLLKV